MFWSKPKNRISIFWSKLNNRIYMFLGANLLDPEVFHGEAGVVDGQVHKTLLLNGTLDLNTSGTHQETHKQMHHLLIACYCRRNDPWFEKHKFSMRAKHSVNSMFHETLPWASLFR